MASTLNGTGITFSDSSTIASGSAFGAIGTVGTFYNTNASAISPNGTVSGSYLFYQSAGTTYVIVDQNLDVSFNPINRTTAFTWNGSNTFSPIGAGTWRMIAAGRTRAPSWSGCVGFIYFPVLYVRVS